MDRIGGLNYTVKSDVGGFQKGMVLSRSELNLTRREMRNSQTDAEKFATKLDVLERAFNAGAIELGDYHKTVVRLNSETPQAKAAAAEIAEQRKRAAEVTRQMATEEERLVDQIRELQSLKPHLSAETYARSIDKLNAKLPKNIAAEERRASALARSERRQELINREMDRGRATTRSVETATEKYAREVHDLDRQLRRGSISQETHRRAVDRAGEGLRNQRMQLIQQIPIVGRFSGAVTGLSPAFAAAGIGIAAGVAGAYAFGRAVSHVTSRVHEQMAAIDQTAKTAARLGMTMEGLTAIRFAGADVAGVDQSTVDMAMQFLNRSTAEAAKGLGKAKQAFKDLGIDAARLSIQDPGEIFKQVADAIVKVKDPAEQLRLSFKLFGSEGVGLVSLLREGSGAIDDFDQRAKSLGISLSSVDAAQVEQANDALGRLSLSFVGLYNTLAVNFGPQITVVANMMTRFTAGLSGAASGVAKISDEIIYATGRATDFATALYKFETLDFSGAWDSLTNNSGAKFNEAAELAKHEAYYQARLKKKQLEQTRADNEALAAAEANDDAAGSNGSSSNEAGFDAKIKKEHDAWQEMRKRYAMSSAERAEYDKGAEQRANARAAKEAEAQARAGGATAIEAKRLGLMTYQTAELERQAKLVDDAAKEKAQADEKSKQKAQQERDKFMTAGEQLAKSQMTPFETLVDRLKEAEVLLQGGAIDEKTAARERLAARTDFRKTTESADRRPAAISRNSREAYDEITKVFGQANQKKDNLVKEQLAAQQAAAAAAERLVEVMENLQVVNGA